MARIWPPVRCTVRIPLGFAAVCVCRFRRCFLSHLHHRFLPSLAVLSCLSRSTSTDQLTFSDSSWVLGLLLAAQFRPLYSPPEHETALRPITTNIVDTTSAAEINPEGDQKTRQPSTRNGEQFFSRLQRMMDTLLLETTTDLQAPTESVCV